MVSLKEEGFASFMFLRKWLVLKGDTLSIHKSEVRWISAQLPRSRPDRLPCSSTDAMLRSPPYHKA